jgi:hypothetical protein
MKGRRERNGRRMSETREVTIRWKELEMMRPRETSRTLSRPMKSVHGMCYEGEMVEDKRT